MSKLKLISSNYSLSLSPKQWNRLLNLEYGDDDSWLIELNESAHKLDWYSGLFYFSCKSDSEAQIIVDKINKLLGN